MGKLNLAVDPQHSLPLYMQFVWQVRRLLALGALRPGDRCPPVRQIAASAGVNRNTAARAVAELRGQGLVRTRPGMGTFFADRAPFVPAVQRESALDSAIEALLIEAHTLGVAPEEIGFCLSRKLEYFARARRERDGQST